MNFAEASNLKESPFRLRFTKLPNVVSVSVRPFTETSRAPISCSTRMAPAAISARKPPLLTALEKLRSAVGVHIIGC